MGREWRARPALQSARWSSTGDLRAVTLPHGNAQILQPETEFLSATIYSAAERLDIPAFL